MVFRTLKRLSALFLMIALTGVPAFAAGAKLTGIEPNKNGVLEKVFVLSAQPWTGPVGAVEPSAELPRLQAGRALKVTLFHFNDLHNHLTIPHKKKGATHYFSQMYKQVAQARSLAGPDELVLFVSAGDDHTGSVLDELVGWDAAGPGFSPAYRVYTAAGLDMDVIGNHELDRGAAVLARAIRQDAGFPLLSANIHGSKFLDSKLYHPAALTAAKGATIGFIGLTTPVDTHTGEANDPGLTVAGPLQTLKNLLPAVAEQADLVIVLSHCGYGEASGAADRYIAEGDVALAKAAAKLTDKPVIFVGGHTHTALNRTGLDPINVFGQTVVLQAHGRGKALGIFQTVISKKGDSTVLDQPTAKLISLKKRDDRKKPGDKNYAALEHDGDYDHAFEKKNLTPILARLEDRLNTVIGRVEAGDQVGRAATIADRYITETALANFMNDAVVAMSRTFPNGRVDVALFNASGVNTGIPARGKLTFADWYAVMPYADTIQVGEMTGAQIKTMLINNAKRLVRPEETTGAKQVDLTGYVSRGFLHFSKAVRYTIRLNGSAAEATAEKITVNGQPIDQVLDKKFKVAFNSYIGAGGFGEAWNGKKVGAGVKGDVVGYNLRGLPKLDTGLVYRNQIVKYIKDQGVITAQNGAAKDGRLTVIP